MAHRVEVFDRVKQAHAKLLEGYSCTAVASTAGRLAANLELEEDDIPVI